MMLFQHQSCVIVTGVEGRGSEYKPAVCSVKPLLLECLKTCILLSSFEEVQPIPAHFFLLLTGVSPTTCPCEKECKC